MNLLVKGNREGPLIVDVTPESAGWKYVGFRAMRIPAGHHVGFAQPSVEQCIVVLSGVVDIESSGKTWSNLGARASVFEDRAPYALYLPHPRDGVKVTAHGNSEIGIASAPGPGVGEPRVIEPSQMKRSVRGTGANTRYVCDILPQTEPASHLLVVEVRTPSGHSSSYPPHKHDVDNLPMESSLEETYYHRLDPPQGFAFQRVYTDDRSIDQALAVENNDCVIVPRGYHPVVVPYGYESYYLNVMAGPTREWHFKNDPAHEWMLKR
jgi:5-deoxy-glucuronate isomerase